MLAIYQFWFRISLFYVFNQEEKQEGTCWSIGYDLRYIPAEKRVPLWYGGKFRSHAACCRAGGGTDSAPELLPRQIEHQSWPSERRGELWMGGTWGLWGPPDFLKKYVFRSKSFSFKSTLIGTSPKISGTSYGPVLYAYVWILPTKFISANLWYDTS